MMILKRNELIECVSYERFFEWRAHPGAGFSFPCDEDGKVDIEELRSLGRDNYVKCLNGTHGVDDRGVQEFRHTYREPAIGQCNHCRQDVVLDGFTNTCEKCGTDYNHAGQELAPREQWGHETGECVSDILAIDRMSTDELLR